MFKHGEVECSVSALCHRPCLFVLLFVCLSVCLSFRLFVWCRNGKFQQRLRRATSIDFVLARPDTRSTFYQPLVSLSSALPLVGYLQFPLYPRWNAPRVRGFGTTHDFVGPRVPQAHVILSVQPCPLADFSFRLRHLYLMFPWISISVLR